MRPIKIDNKKSILLRAISQQHIEKNFPLNFILRKASFYFWKTFKWTMGIRCQHKRLYIRTRDFYIL